MFGTNPLHARSNYWDYLVPVSGKLTSVHQLLPNLCDRALFSPENEESRCGRKRELILPFAIVSYVKRRPHLSQKNYPSQT